MWPPPYFYPSMIASFSNVGCLPRHQHPIWEPTVSQNEILRLSSSSSSSSIRYWKCRDISLLAHDISLSFFWSFVALNFSFFFFFDVSKAAYWMLLEYTDIRGLVVVTTALAPNVAGLNPSRGRILKIPNSAFGMEWI